MEGTLLKVRGIVEKGDIKREKLSKKVTSALIIDWNDGSINNSQLTINNSS
jgi:hypothetical protein